MLHIKITSEYKDSQFIDEFVKKIPVVFEDEGGLLYDKRNTIKEFPVDSPEFAYRKLVVKKFKRSNIFQSFAYSFFCDSKAARAFNNATELRKRKINTPREIAYIEEYRNCLLKSSYVITNFTDGQPIQDFFIAECFDENVAREFALFVVELHEKGILHHDLNSTNVLYHKSGQGSYFSIIDINRMKIKPDGNKLSSNECFENLTRFTGSMKLFEYVLRHYIKYRKWNECMVERAMKIKIDHDKQWVRRKTFFNKLKKIYHV